MNKQAFVQGFMQKCAEYDLTLNQANLLLKQAFKNLDPNDSGGIDLGGINPVILSALIGGGIGGISGAAYGGLGEEGSLTDAVMYGGAGALGGGVLGGGAAYGLDKLLAKGEWEPGEADPNLPTGQIPGQFGGLPPKAILDKVIEAATKAKIKELMEQKQSAQDKNV